MKIGPVQATRSAARTAEQSDSESACVTRSEPCEPSAAPGSEPAAYADAGISGSIPGSAARLDVKQMSRKTNRRAIEKLEALYASLPRVNCRGLCSIACGSVPMTKLEAERTRKADSKNRLPMISKDVTCVYLSKSNRCAVYDARPLICRVWGTVKALSCPHGCIPDRWLSPAEFLRTAQEVERIGGELLLPTTEGLIPYGDSWSSIQQTFTDDEMELLAEKTRNLRALHGGRIVGVTPSDSNETNWIDLDKLAAERLKGK